MFSLSPGSVEWEELDKTNCYRGRGAAIIDPNPWKVWGKTTFSLSECQEECAKKSSCEGIVIDRRRSGQCVLRASLQPDKCRTSSRHVVYIRRDGKGGKEAEEKKKGEEKARTGEHHFECRYR